VDRPIRVQKICLPIFLFLSTIPFSGFLNDQVQELFHELADLPAEARARYFAEHGVDEQTRREVEALLASGTFSIEMPNCI